MLERPVTIYNAALKNTSSWANTYLDRDHHAPEAEERDEHAGNRKAATKVATHQSRN